jgi:hypothetical protein
MTIFVSSRKCTAVSGQSRGNSVKYLFKSWILVFAVMLLLDSWMIDVERQNEANDALNRLCKQKTKSTSKPTMSNNINTSKAQPRQEKQQQQQQLQLLQQRIDELRVAYQEVTTVVAVRNKGTGMQSLPSHPDHGNNRNNVYIQLSSGSVAMWTDRTVAEARISRQLQQTREEFEALQDHE